MNNSITNDSETVRIFVQQDNLIIIKNTGTGKPSVRMNSPITHGLESCRIFVSVGKPITNDPEAGRLLFRMDPETALSQAGYWLRYWLRFPTPSQTG